MNESEKFLEIGDKIKVTNFLGGIFFYEINKVTKTKANAILLSNPSSTQSFKRAYYRPDSIQPFSKIKWDTSKYELLK